MEGLLSEKKLFILDMDGTIYLDETPIDGAREFIAYAKAKGKRIIYFTNNASKSIEMYYEKLNRLGFDVSEGEVISSADVTIDFLNRNHKNQKVYLVGTPALEKSFTDGGINLSDGTEADIVVVSFDTTLTYEKLKKACRLIDNGAIFYSTHPDFVCPVKEGFIPDSGAICALVTAATGKIPRYFGKPYLETAEFLVNAAGVDFKSSAVVGDRLYTDIALGKNNNITSIMVLSGETKEIDITDQNRPDIVVENIGNLIKEL
ncbi:MAG: HAD-IIA family hydrolase [Clostridiales bacterium]|jgi:HAD superfamily hydrolase (TIGR01450 family)|nr:HAD-IIA family hydrolase [Clostridiales bacterium]